MSCCCTEEYFFLFYKTYAYAGLFYISILYNSFAKLGTIYEYIIIINKQEINEDYVYEVRCILNTRKYIMWHISFSLCDRFH